MASIAAPATRDSNAAAQVHYTTVNSADGVKSADWLTETTVLHGDRSRHCGVLQPWATPGFVRPYGSWQRVSALDQMLRPQKMRYTQTQSGRFPMKVPAECEVAMFSDDFRCVPQNFMPSRQDHREMSISTLLNRRFASKASRPRSLPIPERL